MKAVIKKVNPSAKVGFPPNVAFCEQSFQDALTN